MNNLISLNLHCRSNSRSNHLNVYQSLSSGTSIASSDCSDEYDLALDNDSEDLFGDITASILNVIQDADLSGEFQT